MTFFLQSEVEAAALRICVIHGAQQDKRSAKCACQHAHDRKRREQGEVTKQTKGQQHTGGAS